jgi:hypothetical protein
MDRQLLASLDRARMEAGTTETHPMTNDIEQIRKRLEAAWYQVTPHVNDIRFLLAQLEAKEKQLADALKVTTAATINHVATKPR